MGKQLTPAEDLRVFDRAMDILAEGWGGTLDDCPNPEKFEPSGKCKNPSTALCGKCFRDYAINKAMEEMTGVPAADMMGKGDYAYTVPFYGKPRGQLMDLILIISNKVTTKFTMFDSMQANRKGIKNRQV